MKNIVAAILTVACVVFAALIGVQAFGQEPKALGWERGQSVPEGAIVKKGIAQGPSKTDYAQPVAGLHEVLVSYTDKQGVCSVAGFHNLTSNNVYGITHRSKTDEWADRVFAKFDGVAGEKSDANFDTLFDEPKYWLRALERGNAFYLYSWRKNLPEGYSAVDVAARPSYIRLMFKFDNWDACEAEREAATQAEL